MADLYLYQLRKLYILQVSEYYSTSIQNWKIDLPYDLPLIITFDWLCSGGMSPDDGSAEPETWAISIADTGAFDSDLLNWAIERLRRVLDDGSYE